MLTINIGGRLLDFGTTRVMGILNVTPDSFYADSRAESDRQIERRVTAMIEEHADIIDVGACSTRPGSTPVAADEEWHRISNALSIVRRVAPSAIVSVDTFRADIAERCVGEYGANIINDISGGTVDADMFDTVARLHVPYILTHNKPHTALCSNNIAVDVTQWLAERTDQLHQMGVADVVVDPGLGFGKTTEQNMQLLRDLTHLKRELDAPVLIGLSRKSMIRQTVHCTPDNALNGTSVLNTIAIENGADILRVHDVGAAIEVVKLYRSVYF